MRDKRHLVYAYIEVAQWPENQQGTMPDLRVAKRLAVSKVKKIRIAEEN